MQILDKGIIQVLSEMEQRSLRLYHTSLNGKQFKIYELFIFGIIHLICLDYHVPQGTETMESETANGGGCYTSLCGPQIFQSISVLAPAQSKHEFERNVINTIRIQLRSETLYLLSGLVSSPSYLLAMKFL